MQAVATKKFCTDFVLGLLFATVALLAFSLLERNKTQMAESANQSTIQASTSIEQ